ncbi:Hypothetical_protein [Hexamita inflata]|uniref:Hypothetical_protein n=1 Tax=Hexamita inflata TaxID=28002 RepID=A0AA86NYT3_9EUKA|nr:Hypothetical protein HINF_LOCUS16782 [Hexamita inflata]
MAQVNTEDKQYNFNRVNNVQYLNKQSEQKNPSLKQQQIQNLTALLHQMFTQLPLNSKLREQFGEQQIYQIVARIYADLQSPMKQITSNFGLYQDAASLSSMYQFFNNSTFFRVDTQISNLASSESSNLIIQHCLNYFKQFSAFTSLDAPFDINSIQQIQQIISFCAYAHLSNLQLKRELQEEEQLPPTFKPGDYLPFTPNSCIAVTDDEKFFALPDFFGLNEIHIQAPDYEPFIFKGFKVNQSTNKTDLISNNKQLTPEQKKTTTQLLQTAQTELQQKTTKNQTEPNPKSNQNESKISELNTNLENAKMQLKQQIALNKQQQTSNQQTTEQLQKLVDKKTQIISENVQEILTLKQNLSQLVHIQDKIKTLEQQKAADANNIQNIMSQLQCIRVEKTQAEQTAAGYQNNIQTQKQQIDTQKEIIIQQEKEIQTLQQKSESLEKQVKAQEIVFQQFNSLNAAKQQQIKKHQAIQVLANAFLAVNNTYNNMIPLQFSIIYLILIAVRIGNIIKASKITQCSILVLNLLIASILIYFVIMDKSKILLGFEAMIRIITMILTI